MVQAHKYIKHSQDALKIKRDKVETDYRQIMCALIVLMIDVKLLIAMHLCGGEFSFQKQIMCPNIFND
jgi:hypothetical protein